MVEDPRIDILADNYPLEDILEQNDIEVAYVLGYLIEEGLVDLDDYFYEDVEEDEL